MIVFVTTQWGLPCGLSGDSVFCCYIAYYSPSAVCIRRFAVLFCTRARASRRPRGLSLQFSQYESNTCLRSVNKIVCECMCATVRE